MQATAAMYGGVGVDADIRNIGTIGDIGMIGGAYTAVGIKLEWTVDDHERVDDSDRRA